MDKFQELYLISINDHYTKRYIKFISDCITNNTNHDIIERHHILPKSLFPEYQNLNQNPWNEAKLTPRQHFIAHWMLAKALGGKMHQAFWCMANLVNENFHNREKMISKNYEKMKVSLIQYLRETMVGQGNPMFGKRHSERTKEIMSDKAKEREHNPMEGKCHSEHTKEIMSDKAKERFKDIEYLSNHIANIQERIKNNPNCMKPLWDGYKRYLEANGHPRLGKTNSAETREKISIGVRKKFKDDPTHRLKWVGENNPNYGREYSKEERDIRSKIAKRMHENETEEKKNIRINKMLKTKEERLKDSEYHYNYYLKYRTEEYKEKMSASVKKAKAKLTDEEKAEINKKRSEAAKRRYANMTKEERDELSRKQKEGRNKIKTQ